MSRTANVADLHAQLDELRKQVAAKDAEIESLRKRPSVPRAFSKRNLHAAVIANPATTIEHLDELARANGMTYKPNVVKSVRRHALDFIELAKQAGRWVEDKSY